jgi:hypothetical protein
VVEDPLRPGAIDAAENDVAIQSCFVPGCFYEAAFDCTDLEPIRCATSLQLGLEYLHFQFANVFFVRVEQSVKIVTFDAIEIDDRNPPDSHACECLGYERANAASSDNTDVKSGKNCLQLVAPHRYGATLLLLGRWDWQAWSKAHAQRGAGDADSFAVGGLVFPWSCFLPESRTPASRFTSERKPNEGEFDC